MKFRKSVLNVCLIGVLLAMMDGTHARVPTMVIGCVENNYAQYPNCPFNGPVTMAMTPIGITPAKAYVCNTGVFGGTGSISVIDVATDTVIKCVENDYAYCPFNEPESIAITPDGTKAYVANFAGGTVSVIDVATDTVINCVENDYVYCPFKSPFGIAITPLSVTPAKAYVCNYAGNSVSVIDVATDTVIKCVENDYVEYPNCPFNFPIAIAITPNGSKAYVCNAAVNGGPNSVSIIDVATDTVIGCVTNDYAEYPNCPFNEPLAIAITPNGKKAYVCNSGEHGGPASVSVIDVATDTVIGCVMNDYAYCPFNVPADIAITLDGSTAYVCNLLGNSVAIIDVATDTVIGCVEPANYPGCPFFGPYGIAITPDGFKAYVANEFGSSVSIIGVPATPANPPTNVQGVRSCYGTELILTITWTASTTPTVSSYNIYNGATLVGNVLATSPLTFSTPLISPDEGLNFFVSAVGPESTRVAVVTQGPMNCSILPPTSLSGCTIQYGYTVINTITWQPPTSGVVPIAYQIYRDAYLYDLIATVSAAGPLSYQDTETLPNVSYTYYIVSVDSHGDRSEAASITVTQECPPSVSILPPASVSGCKTKNRFLLQTDFINNITWTAPASGTAPVAYKIYRDAYLTDLVATVPASGALQYYDHDRNPGIVYSYYIVSVDGSGNQSTANSVTVTNPC